MDASGGGATFGAFLCGPPKGSRRAQREPPRTTKKAGPAMGETSPGTGVHPPGSRFNIDIYIYIYIHINKKI